MFNIRFQLILENESGNQVDISQTSNKYMTSKVERLSRPLGTISTSTYPGMSGSYLNNEIAVKAGNLQTDKECAESLRK